MNIDIEIKNICIPPSMPISNAVMVLNEGHCRIVLVTDSQERLLGVIADGDIRRALLKGMSFDLPVRDIMETNPVVALTSMNENKIFSLMWKTKCYEIPVLDSKNRITGLRMIDGFIGRKHQSEVIIMAGGQGKRLRPLTETEPKPLITIGGKPILFILLDQLIMTGFKKIILSINYKADMIKNAISVVPSYNKLIHYIEEKEPLGTAGSLSLLDPFPTSPFFVMNADLLTKTDLTAMMRFHEMENNDLTIASLEKIFQVPFGVLKTKQNRIVGIEEKPVRKDLVSAGIYILSPMILDLIPKNQFYDMPDLVNDAVVSGKQVGNFPIHEYWIDIGRHDELRQARKEEHLFY